MATEKKKFSILNETETDFIENVNGSCLGYVWTGTDSIERRVIFISASTNLLLEYKSVRCVYQFFFEGRWITSSSLEPKATRSDYVNLGNPDQVNFPDGTINLDPYEIDGSLKPYLADQWSLLLATELQTSEGFLDFLIRNIYSRNDITGSFS